MKARILSFLVWIVLLAAAQPQAVHAQAGLTVTNNQALQEFPERLTFSVDLQSEVPITRVVLEYGVAQLTCADVFAKAFPEITPGAQLAVSWTWEMKQSGSQPPGATIWWRWRVTDANGAESVTETSSLVWLDAERPWQTIRGGNINLHWYGGGNSFGRQLHTSAVQSLQSLARTTGLIAHQPIDLYIYSNLDDLRAAVLYEPGWTGGLAYADHNLAVIGISPDQMAWGKRAQAHELTHVLVGHLTFGCLSHVPTWLNEGLAVYGEGGPEPYTLDQLEAAIAADELLPVRALSGSFSEDPAQADLSYSQSYSLTKHLIDAYGREKMLNLLTLLREGIPVDEALLAVYGFDVEGFEDEWRAAVGAAPRRETTTDPTATPLPTPVPTIVPVSGVSVPVHIEPTPAATAVPPVSAASPVSKPTSSAMPTWALIVVVGLCGLLIAGMGVGVAAFILWRRR